MKKLAKKYIAMPVVVLLLFSLALILSPLYKKPVISDTYRQVTALPDDEGVIMEIFYHTNSAGIPDPGQLSTCPSGWSTYEWSPGVNEGYGPHYIGILVYDWYIDGWILGGGGYRGPGSEDPPGARPPGDPPPGDPVSTPEPGGADGPENPIPRGGEITPPPFTAGGEIYQGLLDTTPLLNPQYASSEKMGSKNILSWLSLVKTAQAEETINSQQTTHIRSVAIGSDSVCSQSRDHIVPFYRTYNNVNTPGYFSLNSEACDVNGCNRCKVCYK